MDGLYNLRNESGTMPKDNHKQQRAAEKLLGQRIFREAEEDEGHDHLKDDWGQHRDSQPAYNKIWAYIANLVEL
ncbi:hypothetical protein PABG_07139 [Paracoccidioides brasiliensis Pb03]|uniref:Uncharacterized protein n=1 Tax=Paracoccidioides brasiliensis (strain Pb18) TaxID=502780 RepID=C1GCW6_PARBD|nr:uncharacterized protein PADG_05102 [Paracoccidioides brasiliensis Pb18]EEH17052.1 hypothetical protein PABG_07139 [Paracoccidioides brasiliensis Pb03]EEH49023.2 hypothetical protein PADG_05102 [Paracoccidioides brasiliensis Pb18]